MVSGIMHSFFLKGGKREGMICVLKHFSDIEFNIKQTIEININFNSVWKNVMQTPTILFSGTDKFNMAQLVSHKQEKM